uniref:Uncharacterized protein n=1 Tax=Romanomermis culicivorax TaxID=13658 RepID=A0A915K8R8_ROMCU
MYINILESSVNVIYGQLVSYGELVCYGEFIQLACHVDLSVEKSRLSDDDVLMISSLMGLSRFIYTLLLMKRRALLILFNFALHQNLKNDLDSLEYYKHNAVGKITQGLTIFVPIYLSLFDSIDQYSFIDSYCNT